MQYVDTSVLVAVLSHETATARAQAWLAARDPSMAQVRMPSWSRGRITLVGDAGYCPSPMSGQGTSLALVGAYVLADELARTRNDHAAAFARTEARLRPFIDINQALATRERPDDEVPQSKIDEAKNAFVLDAPNSPA